MSDSSSAWMAAEIFVMLAHGWSRLSEPVRRDRRRIAAKVRQVFNGCDFNDDDLGAYDALLTLKLAKKCKHCGEGYTDWNADQHGDDCADR